MPREDEVRKAIKTEWRCLGFFGYGQGAAHRRWPDESVEVCQQTCTQRKQCWEAHKRRVDERQPRLAQIRTRALERAREEGRRYELQDYGRELSRELGRQTTDLEKVDPWLVQNARNIENGQHGNPPNVGDN